MSKGLLNFQQRSRSNSKGQEKPTEPDTRHVLTSKDENATNNKTFKRLYQEKIRNASSKAISTPSRELREQEELKECTFKPMINEASQIMAKNHRNKLTAIEDELNNDAKHRRTYKRDFKQTVYCNISIGSSGGKKSSRETKDD